MELIEIRNRVIKELKKRKLDYDIDDIDDAVNTVNRQHIQPVALLGKQVEYTTTEDNEEIAISTLGTDIYKIDFVRDVSYYEPGSRIEVINTEDTLLERCIRRTENTLYLYNIDAGTKLNFYCHQKLKKIGPGEGETLTPEINEAWHDLYWLGALAEFDISILPVFMQRLSVFTSDRREKTGQKYFMVRKAW